MTGSRLHVAEAPPRISFVIGIDPGPGLHGSAGVAVLDLPCPGHSRIYQCNAAAAPGLLEWVLRDFASYGTRRLAGQIEGFAPGTGPGARQNSTGVQQQVDQMAAIAARHGMPLAARYAAMAKGWATDKRLKAAGVYDLAPGSTHGRDAMRHAMFRAHRDCGWADPLSHRGGAAS